MEKYKFEFSEKQKRLTIIFNGFFEEKDAEEFISEYSDCVERLSNSKQYDLYLDCKGMDVVKAVLLDSLSNIISRYANDFKKIIVLDNKGPKIFKIQAEKIVNELNLNDKIERLEE